MTAEEGPDVPVGANHYRLKFKHKKWITTAAAFLSDQFMDDLDTLSRGGEWSDTHMSAILPVQFASRYDLAFAKRMWDTLIVVEWKIRDRRWWSLSSLAEELIMRAILETAVAIAELEGEAFDPHDYAEEIFEDCDFEILFNLSLDGIEHDRDMMTHMGFDLRFESWFKPYEHRLVCREKHSG